MLKVFFVADKHYPIYTFLLERCVSPYTCTPWCVRFTQMYGPIPDGRYAHDFLVIFCMCISIDVRWKGVLHNL